MLRGFGEWLEEDPRGRFCVLKRRNYTRNGHVWNPMPDIELESLSGGGSYFWKGSSVREKGGSDEPPPPPGYGPEQVYLFWTKMTTKAESIYVGEPVLPRRRNAPMRFGGGLCAGDFTETAKDLNRQEYFEATNIIVACIQDQSDQHMDTPFFVH